MFVNLHLNRKIYDVFEIRWISNFNYLFNDPLYSYSIPNLYQRKICVHKIIANIDCFEGFLAETQGCKSLECWNISVYKGLDKKIILEKTIHCHQDPRMMVSEDLSRGEWELRITDIRHSDAGNYECQINTNPLLSHTISLSVVGKLYLN